MRLKEITIEHFRCFDSYNVEFAPQATVLFGKNGAGKSSLIAAIHKALSFIFDKNPQIKDDFTLSAGNSQLRVEGFSRSTDMMINPGTGNAFPFIGIHAEGDYLGQTLLWSIEAPTSTYRLAKSKYKEAFSLFINMTKESWHLPLLAYYSDGYPHIEAKRKIDKSILKLRNFGYYQWNLESACSKIWIERLERTIKSWERLTRVIQKNKETGDTHNAFYEASIVELRDASHEIHSIVDCLKSFTEGDNIIDITDISLGTYDEKLSISTRQGRTYHFRTLPAGYRRLLYIVLDIAYRGFVLNKDTQSSGIVIIDEIDLHLHPELEKNVLNRFLKTFPNIQFIVSTHSPLVLTNLDTENGNRRILRMTIGESSPTDIGNIYGLDYNSGIEDIMGVGARNEEIESLLDTLAFLQKNDMKEQADNIFKFILEKLGGDENRVKTILEKRLKEMGNEIYR